MVVSSNEFNLLKKQMHELVCLFLKNIPMNISNTREFLSNAGVLHFIEKKLKFRSAKIDENWIPVGKHSANYPGPKWLWEIWETQPWKYSAIHKKN